MDFKSIYYNTNPLIPPMMYMIGVFSWVFAMKISSLQLKKIIKDEIMDEHKEELKNIKIDDISGFSSDLINEYKFSSLIKLLYFISMLMMLTSVLAIFDSSKMFLCVSYIILPIFELVIFKMTKSKLKEKLDNNATISISQCTEKKTSYKLVID